MKSNKKPIDLQSVVQQECIDTLIVPGYGPVMPGHAHGSGRLNMYGRINTLAAAMLCQYHTPKLVIVSGGRTGGNDMPSEAELMAQIIRPSMHSNTNLFVEDQATNTILNFVYAANFIDQSVQEAGSILVVAMGFHLPRITEICSLVGIPAHYVAAESILSERSPRHLSLIKRHLNPTRPSYAQTLQSQERFLYALQEIPEYWLPQMAEINSPNRLRTVLTARRLQSFLKSQKKSIRLLSPLKQSKNDSV